MLYLRPVYVPPIVALTRSESVRVGAEATSPPADASSKWLPWVVIGGILSIFAVSLYLEATGKIQPARYYGPGYGGYGPYGHW